MNYLLTGDCISSYPAIRLIQYCLIKLNICLSANAKLIDFKINPKLEGEIN